MRADEYITESLSRIVYHYTRLHSAVKIVSTGTFELTASLGTQWEEQYSPRGYPYYLSTTRTRFGGYHDYIGSDAVLLKLDGTYYNTRYPSKSVDYWGNRNPAQAHHRQHEAEDRLFSKTASIPAKILSVDIYLGEDSEKTSRARARKLVIACKKSDIPVNLYDDKAAWKLGDTRKRAPIEIIGSGEEPGSYSSRHRGYLLPWVELMYKRNKADLSKKADSIRYDLQYTYDKQSLARSLAVDIGNARKPNSGPDRKTLIKIIEYMQRNKLHTVQDFVDHLAQRWKS